MSFSAWVSIPIFLLLCAVSSSQAHVFEETHLNLTSVYQSGPSEDLKQQLLLMRQASQTRVEYEVPQAPQPRVFFLMSLFRLVFAGMTFKLVRDIKKELKEIKELLHEINNKLDELSEQVDSVLRSISQNHDVTRIYAIFGGDILRLKYYMLFFSNPSVYDQHDRIVVDAYSKSWAKAVLSMSYDGISQIMFNVHCMITGCITKPILNVAMDGMLKPSNPRIWRKIDNIVETLIEIQKIGYLCWCTALDIEDRSAEKEVFVKQLLKKRLNIQEKLLTIDKRIKTWPAGTYGMVSPASGCANNWEWGFGYRRHGTENTRRDNNRGSEDFEKYIKANVGDNYLTWFFCIKRKSLGHIKWPQGTYCLFKYNSCPPNFSEGSITFDDVNKKNTNYKEGMSPSGVYNHDTTYNFCCRYDGNVNNTIFLPITHPFVLFPLHGHTCQKVHRMRATEVYLYWDCEDGRYNTNKRFFPYPKETQQGPNMKIFMCHYDVIV